MLYKISSWVFDGLRLTIYRQSCDACYAAGHIREVLDNLQEMESIFRDEIRLRTELNVWVTGKHLDDIQLGQPLSRTLAFRF